MFCFIVVSYPFHEDESYHCAEQERDRASEYFPEFAYFWRRPGRDIDEPGPGLREKREYRQYYDLFRIRDVKHVSKDQPTLFVAIPRFYF